MTEFLAAVHASRKLHRPWVTPPDTPTKYSHWLERLTDPRSTSFLVRRRDDHALAGVINISEIVRGIFQSAYLGYYSFAPHHGQGLMSEGLAQVLTRAFIRLRLHRLEANIQPDNTASLALVRRLGFRLEGYSPRYLKLGGQWRDHQRWAITREEWAGRRRATE